METTSISVASGRELIPVRTRRRLQTILLYLVLGIVAIPFFLPIYWVFVSSVKTTPELNRLIPTWWPQTFTLQHHIMVWSESLFPRYFLNSIIYAGGATLIAVESSTLLAYVLAKHPSKYGNLLFGLLLATMMVPFATYVVPLFGVLVSIQNNLGIPMLNTHWGMISLWVVYPFGTFLMRQGMFSVPNDLLDAAKIDGASTLGIYWRVVRPLLRAHRLALAIYLFKFRYDDVLWPLVVAMSQKMYPISIGLLQYVGGYFTEYGNFTAAAAVAILPVVIVYLFLQRYIIQGVALTGMKG